MKYKGIIFTFMSALLFGITPVLATVTYGMGSTPETLTFYRNLFAVPILMTVLLIKKVDIRITLKSLLKIMLIGTVGCGMTTLMLYKSYEYVGIGTATTLHFLYPVFVALICFLIYKEKLSVQKLAALILAVTGIFFFADKNQTSGWIGLILAVASGLTYSFYMIGIEKKGLKDIDPYKVSFYIALSVSCALLIYNIPTHSIIFTLPPKAMLYTLIISFCTSFLAVVLLQSGIKYLGASTAAILCLFEPVAGMISGALFLNEQITVSKSIGCILIITAVVILIIRLPKSRNILRKIQWTSRK